MDEALQHIPYLMSSHSEQVCTERTAVHRDLPHSLAGVRVKHRAVLPPCRVQLLPDLCNGLHCSHLVVGQHCEAGIERHKSALEGLKVIGDMRTMLAKGMVVQPLDFPT